MSEREIQKERESERKRVREEEKSDKSLPRACARWNAGRVSYVAKSLMRWHERESATAVSEVQGQVVANL